MSRDADGYLICAVRGCEEPARPWVYQVAMFDDLEVEVRLCQRHERVALGQMRPIEERPSS
jgi:hypothetical protein